MTFEKYLLEQVFTYLRDAPRILDCGFDVGPTRACIIFKLTPRGTFSQVCKGLFSATTAASSCMETVVSILEIGSGSNKNGA